MVIDIKVPALAESVAEANLIQWHKKVGDFIQCGENLIDIETDKVTLEVTAPNDGVLIEILKQNGEDVESGELIAKIQEKKVVTTTTNTEEKSEIKPKTNVIEDVPQQQMLLDPEPAPESWQATISKSTETTPKLSPAVRSLLSNNGLKVADIKLLKNPNRISKEDILNHLRFTSSQEILANSIPATSKATVQDEVVPEKPASEHIKIEEATPKVVTSVTNVNQEQRQQERVPMTRLRKRVAERLLAAQHENALLTTFNEVNMQAVMDLRHRYRDEFKQAHHVKLGFMSFFIQAAVEALKKFPIINASVEGDAILYRGYFDIGVAISSERGLVVPVLRNADTLSFADIESKIVELGKKVNDGKLAIEELIGGTFTLTNGGTFGSLLSTPIINPPQSAILGMHKIQERPIAERGAVVIRPMMYLALSYDHRIIDGREAVQFLVSIKEQIEDPLRLLLQI